MNLSAIIEGDLRAHAAAKRVEAEAAMMRAATVAAGVVKDRYRGAVRAAGLGDRLANTIRGDVYPQRGKRSLSAAAYVYTKAPELIRVFAFGATIRPVKDNHYLWIPTENVPGGGFRAGRKMQPHEVEERFGDFEYVPSLTRPGIVLAVVPAIRSKSQKGWRRATAGRTKQGRNAIRIVMFVLVRQVSLKARIDIDRVVAEAATAWPGTVARSLAAAFRDDVRTS